MKKIYYKWKKGEHTPPLITSYIFALIVESQIIVGQTNFDRTALWSLLLGTLLLTSITQLCLLNFIESSKEGSK